MKSIWSILNSFSIFFFQIRNIRKVIQLTKDSLDELNKKFGNDQQPNPMYVEVSLLINLLDKIKGLKGKFALHSFDYTPIPPTFNILYKKNVF